MHYAIWIGMAGVAWLAGCARAEPTHSPSDHPVTVSKTRSALTRAPVAPRATIELAEPDERTLLRLCGMNVPGVYAEASPFDGGMGVLVTTGDRTHVDALRELGREMSGNNATYRSSPQDEEEEDATADPALAVTVTAQDIDNGVLLIVAPRHSKDATVLAQRIRGDVENLSTGNCTTGDQTIGLTR